MKASLAELSEYTWGRTRSRLEGLTDEEYLWEPVGGCWTLRPAGDGAYHPDGGFPADPPPFTTMAWRMCHLIVCYGARRNREWLGLPAEGGVDRFGPSAAVPGRAAQAVARLESAYSEWTATLHMVDEAAMNEPLGPVAGPFANSDKGGFILHLLDEFIHHGAELALLRDLWRARYAS